MIRNLWFAVQDAYVEEETWGIVITMVLAAVIMFGVSIGFGGFRYGTCLAAVLGLQIIGLSTWLSLRIRNWRLGRGG